MEKKELNIKNEILKNKKISFYVNKWSFVNPNEIFPQKYKYIYDYSKKIFGNVNEYIIDNNLYFFEFKNSKDFILVAFPKKYYDVMTNKIKNSWLFYNIYNTHYFGSKQLVTCYDIQKKINNLNKDEQNINWIWFRKTNFKLSNVILKRVSTWFDINPNFKFILWTNINNEEELNDFLSECDINYKNIFLSKTIIKYNHEILYLVNSFYKKNLLKIKDSKILLDIFYTNETHDIIYKTDYLRYIIIYEYGGFYVDFNDCICLEPLEYFLLFHEKDLIFGKDSSSQEKIDFNNYFIYSKKNNNNLLNYMLKSTSFFPQIYNFIIDKEIIKIQIDIFYNIIDDIKNNKLIDYQLYKKKYIEKFLQLTYFDIDIKDNLVNFIKNNNIILLLLTKYLEYVVEYEENITIILNNIKNNHIINNNINVDFIHKFFDYHFENNIKDFIFINTGIYLHNIIGIINIPFFCKTYLKIDIDTIDSCYLLKHMSYLSFIGHLYDNTCYGNEKNYSNSDDLF